MFSGQPGIGKTSSLAFLALKWVDEVGTCFIASCQIPFDLVFLIRLQFVRSNEPLVEVIKQHHRHIKHISSGYINSVLVNKRVLLMLDGYDEYTPGTNKDIDGVIESGIGNCFLILTSRPGDYLKREIRDQMDGEIIIEGFSDDQIRESFTKYLGKTLSTEMLIQAKQTGIYDLLRVPVILTMTTTLFSRQKSLPRSKTYLYGNITEMVVKRTTFKNFNSSLKVPQLGNLLDKLGELSWKALRNNELWLKKVRY